LKTKKSQTDEVSDKLREICDQYAPDYTAPVLTNLLVREARRIGLSEEAVVEQIRRIFDLYKARFD